MIEEEKDVNTEEVVTPPDESADSSPAEETQTEESVEAPLEPVVPEETEQQVPYDRFKQVNDERKQLLELLQRQQQAPPVQAAPEAQLGNTPEEREFFRQMKELSRKEAETLLKVKEEQFQKQLEAQQRVIGNLLSRDFRRTHPDVKANSNEEYQISQKIQAGYDPDDAYKVVMFERQGQNATQKAQQSVKQKLQTKKKANVETSSVQQGGLPPPKESFRESLERYGNESGAWSDLS